jgi:uncharacterized protein YhaN
VSLRFERFELRAFGPFTATVLELRDAPGGGLHIICGPNEIGKSTAQRGIGDFLFGIPPRSTDNQLHDYGDMRLAALLVDEQGRRHELVRRKGSRFTLLGPDNQPVDEGLLDSMLGGISREVFESMFSITHESLVVGGKALLAAGGEVGESLFSASLGATGLHELRTELDRQASELFRPRATSSLVLQARAGFETAQAQLRESTLRATTFTEHERQLKTARADRKQLAEGIRDARTGQNARERLRTVIPLLARREQIREELADLADAAHLPEDAAERRVRAVERAAREARAADDERGRVDDLEQRIAQLDGEPSILERESAIKNLHGRLANVREGESDLERQTVKLQTATGLAQHALNRVRPDLDLAEAGELRLTETQRAKVDRALDRHAKLTALLDQAEDEAEAAEDRARELTVEVESCDAPRDTAALEAAINEALGDGQVEQRLIAAQDDLAHAQTLLDAAVCEVQPASDVDGLRAMRPPSATTVERFAAEREELDDCARTLGGRRERLGCEQRDLDEDDARLELSTNVPTIADLSAARCERDEHWQRLRHRLEGEGSQPTSPDAFEGQLRHADDLSDRLRADADSVAQRAQFTVRKRRLEAELESLREHDHRLSVDRSDHDRRWAQAWSATGIEPCTPREMAEWLRARQTVLERADAVVRCARMVKAEERSRDGHVETLRDQLTAAGGDPPPGATLRRLLAIAQNQIAQAQAARTERADLMRDLRAARSTTTRQTAKADEYRQGLADWEADWAQIITGNGWPEDVDADSARDVLAAIEKLGQHLNEMTQLAARVSGIQNRLTVFEHDAEQIVHDVAPELASWPAPDAVEELAHRLDNAIQIRSRRQTLEGELDTARKGLKTAERSLEEAEGDLEALVEMASVATPDDLHEAERRSLRAAELRAQLPELERQITEAGQAPLLELIECATGIDVDALNAQAAEAAEGLTRMEEELRELDVHLGELNSERRDMERVKGAASAAELVEQRVGELRELTARYLRLYVAAWALSEAIDAYRRDHKDPLLKRADELFPTLTCGRFRSLEVSFDEADEPVLVGVRSTGERVPVKFMSTGTREQLYLALRVASLERHVELHGPTPVILDDVVLHSDPKRKSAILGALADLGRRTQVIAFSHDPQVVALAQNAIDPESLTVHELGGTEITGALQPLIATADVRPIRPASAA